MAEPMMGRKTIAAYIRAYLGDFDGVAPESILVDPAGADRRAYREIRSRSATNRAPKLARPSGLNDGRRLMRWPDCQYSPILAARGLLSFVCLSFNASVIAI